MTTQAKCNYEAIANILTAQWDSHAVRFDNAERGLQNIIDDLAAHFAQVDPDFDTERFLTIAGWEL